MSEAAYDERYYASVYPNYARQNPPRKMRFYRDLVEGAVAPGTAAPRIYDLGCAFGVFLGSLPANWVRFGSDASAFAIAKGRLDHPGVTFDDTPERLAAEAGTFDVVTAFDVLEHIEDLDGILGTIRRALKAEGRLVAVVPVYDGPLGPVVRALDKDPTHVHKESRAFWLERLSRDWVVERWLGAVRYLIPGIGYAHVPTRALRGIAPAIAFVARKA